MGRTSRIEPSRIEHPILPPRSRPGWTLCSCVGHPAHPDSQCIGVADTVRGAAVVCGAC